MVKNNITLFLDSEHQYAVIEYTCYIFVPVLLSLISIFGCKSLGSDSITTINKIEVSNNDFLANYLAFFFVALSIQKPILFWIVFGLTTVFTFVSRVSYFNSM